MASMAAHLASPAASWAALAPAADPGPWSRSLSAWAASRPSPPPPPSRKSPAGVGEPPAAERREPRIPVIPLLGDEVAERDGEAGNRADRGWTDLSHRSMFCYNPGIDYC